MGKETTVAIFVIFLCVVTATTYDYSGINQEASKTITNRFGNIIVKTPTTSHEHPMHDAAPIIPENNGGSSTLRNSDIFV
ncbi:hypothetical protein H5410_031760 [Solanum commersonii]|uniref:Uncharacterized protein n=1 Tax=Solanum commersonii TaxID=4109 RepID=A0A9J5YNB5_SOLCO|nr:hypothetical protein H5410_031760 [Solanum commersonii]